VVAAFWGVALVTAGLAAAAVVGFARGRRGAAIGACAALALLGALELAWIVRDGLRFEAIHMAYLQLVVAVPLAGVAALVARVRPLAAKLAAVGALLLAPVGAYATFIEPYRLVVERERVPVARERAGERPLRIAVLTDLQTAHVTDYERDALARLMALRPDLILIAGDFYQGQSLQRELPALRELARSLRAPGGVWFVHGDTEEGYDPGAIFAGTAVRTLEDEIARVRIGDRRLAVGGVRLHYETRSARGTIARLERRTGEEDIRILLSHRPDAALEASRGTRIDLTVAGHTHGGQVQLPVFGPPIILSDVPREVGAGGLHVLDGGRRVYVSRGVGVEHAGHAPRVRFGARPEISLLELRG